MGTWGEGIYDNDAALDLLPELVTRVPLDTDPTHLIVGLGLRMWLLDHSPSLYADELDNHADWLEEVPWRAKEALDLALEDDANDDPRPGTRTPQVAHILGSYCDGPRVDELLSVDGAPAVIGELAAVCREYLDNATKQLESDPDLYQLANHLAPLGVLLELSAVCPVANTDQLAAWQALFDRADQNTPDEREFWDDYVPRVQQAFALLRAAAS